MYNTPQPHQSFTDAHSSSLRGGLRLAGFLALMVLFIPVHCTYVLIKRGDVFTIPQLFHRILVRMVGLRLCVHGTPSDKHPVLFVSNHTSYLDVPILASLLRASFVAKSEVEGWPFIGFLSRLQNTVFIERRSTKAASQRTQLRERLDMGHSLILFPEGTSSDGLAVLPFKSSLFSIVGDETGNINVAVQAISMTCTQMDGLPMMRAWRPYYAWYGDMTFAPHLWKVFCLGHFTIDIIFHEPVAAGAIPNRKALAAHCQAQVARGIATSLSGRDVAASASPLALTASS